MTIEVSDTADELATAIALRLSTVVGEIQAQGRTPRIVLTGGTIASKAYELVTAAEAVALGADWTDVDLWFGDERYVPAGHPDRNDQQAWDAFLTRLGVDATHVHAVVGNDCSLSASDAADAYAADLPSEPFDLVLLGMGPDGHVASLFPGLPQVHETQRAVVEVLDSPKPPPVRISLTLPVLNRTARTWFLVSGEGKADAVARAHSTGTLDDTPAVGAHGTDETLWLLDADAASAL